MYQVLVYIPSTNTFKIKSIPLGEDAESALQDEIGDYFEYLVLEDNHGITNTITITQ